MEHDGELVPPEPIVEQPKEELAEHEAKDEHEEHEANENLEQIRADLAEIKTQLSSVELLELLEIIKEERDADVQPESRSFWYRPLKRGK